MTTGAACIGGTRSKRGATVGGASSKRGAIHVGAFGADGKAINRSGTLGVDGGEIGRATTNQGRALDGKGL